MRTIILITLLSIISGCAQYQNKTDFKLEKHDGYDMPVCVMYQYEVEITKPAGFEYDSCGKVIKTPEEYKILTDKCSLIEPKIVNYDYCLSNLPKQVHLVEKKKDDMTICYDRNNKVELPILYCQKDMINVQNVNTYTSVTQRTNVLQKMVLY